MYNFISQYYDMLFPHVEYIKWKCFARPIIQKSRAIQAFKERKETPLVVDAGCGSGALAEILATYYDVIGIDISPDMLDQAMKKYPEADNITWVCQDITKMNIGRKAAAIFATTDTLNHITNQNKLFAFFKRAYESLESGGFLFFDVVTANFFKNNYSKKNECSFEDFEWGSFFWTCNFSERTGRVVYDITGFEKVSESKNTNNADENPGELYLRTDEQINERIWKTDTLREGLTKAGFTSFTVYDNLTSPFVLERYMPWLINTLDDYDRLYFICEKP